MDPTDSRGKMISTLKYVDKQAPTVVNATYVRNTQYTVAHLHDILTMMMMMMMMIVMMMMMIIMMMMMMVMMMMMMMMMMIDAREWVVASHTVVHKV